MKWNLLAAFLLFNCWLAAQSGVKWQQYDTISDQALKLEKLFSLVGKQGNEEVKARALGRISGVYVILGKYDSSLIQVNRALRLVVHSKKDSLVSDLYKQKGNAYYYLNDKTRALEEYQNGFQRCPEGYFQLRASLMTNIGVIHTELKHFSKAESWLKRSLALQEKHKLEETHAYLMTHRILATLYEKFKKFDLSKAEFRKVLYLAKLQNNEEVLLSASTFYGTMLYRNKELDSALYYLDLALELSKKQGNIHSLLAIHHHRSELFKAMQNYARAYDELRLTDSLRAVIYDDQLRNAVSESEAKYQNELLREQNKTARLSAEREKNQRQIIEGQLHFYWILIALLIVSGILIYAIHRLRVRKREALREQKQSEQLIRALFEGEEKERLRIARELHDGVVQDLAVIRQKLGNLEEQIQPEFQQKIHQVEESVRESISEIRAISHFLMPLTLKELGLEASLEQLLERTFENTSIDFDFEYVLTSESLPEKMEVTLYRIVQELVANVIKHSQATEVMVTLIERAGNLTLIVEDNGVGMPDNQSTLGIGLQSVRSRIRMINGDLKFEKNEDDSGTRILVTIAIRD